ncbi:hypothetical protein ANN_26009 [Periplaneta americana]|uniref:C3H1-type domain-containing protein n=1 Tax=Periplaneta americana TaxID=6978 RepID=A0ABQ8S4R1_PERAM|nr:hypothetical protein ANN_26009 [Periplaneta americana]
MLASLPELVRHDPLTSRPTSSTRDRRVLRLNEVGKTPRRATLIFFTPQHVVPKSLNIELANGWIPTRYSDKGNEMALANIKTLVVPHGTDNMSIQRDDLEERKIKNNVISNDDASVGKPDECDRKIRPFARRKRRNALSAQVASDNQNLTSHSRRSKSKYTTSIPREVPSCSSSDNRYLGTLIEGDIASGMSDYDKKTSMTHAKDIKIYTDFPKTRKRKGQSKHVEGNERVSVSKKMKRKTDKTISKKTESNVSHFSENEAVNYDKLLSVRNTSPNICKGHNYLPRYESKVTDRANRPLVDNPRYQLEFDKDNIESSTIPGTCDPPLPVTRRHYKKSHKLEHKELSEKKRRLGKKRQHNDLRNNIKRCNRKMKLCKYYAAGSCTKKEKCLNMHSERPFKSYHTGRGCLAGDRCKFSHKAHNKNMQSLVNTRKEKASKQMKGGHKYISTSLGKKKIPLRLQIKVSIPLQRLMQNTMFRKTLPSPNKYDLPVSEEGGSRTPMPSSPEYDSQNEYGNFAVIQPEDINDLRDSNNEKIHHVECMKVKNVENGEIEQETKGNKEIRRSSAQPITAQMCYDRGRSENNCFPLNLHNKQKELFLRSQQNEKETATSNILTYQEEIELNRINDTEEKKIIEEKNSYSSDEDASLVKVPKNFTNQTSSLSSHKELPHEEISEPMNSILSGIKLQTKNITSVFKESSASKSQLVEHVEAKIQEPKVQARDPRLASRDRSRNNIRASAAMPSSSCCTQTERRLSKNRIKTYNNRRKKISIYNTTPDDIEINGDGDLRGSVSRSITELREIMGLPFNPVPYHKPANEVDASLHSHPPIPYKLVPITIPRPNFCGLKVNKGDRRVLKDPRLRKLFHLSKNDLNNVGPLPPIWSTTLCITNKNREQKNATTETRKRSIVTEHSISPAKKKHKPAIMPTTAINSNGELISSGVAEDLSCSKPAKMTEQFQLNLCQTPIHDITELVSQVSNNTDQRVMLPSINLDTQSQGLSNVKKRENMLHDQKSCTSLTGD